MFKLLLGLRRHNDDLGESEISQLKSNDFEGMDIRSISSSKGGGSDAGNSDAIIVIIGQAEQVSSSDSGVVPMMLRSGRLRQSQASHSILK